MFKIFSKFFQPSSYIGIDIGTYSIKIVEITKKKTPQLKNYAVLDFMRSSVSPFRNFSRVRQLTIENHVPEVMKTMLEEAGIQEKKVFFAVPDFATFFTTFEMPKMSENELKEAIKYEAPRHIPVPLSEVTLDWEILNKDVSSAARFKILLLAVPNYLINQYQQLAQKLNLQIQALEAEVFALKRAILPSHNIFASVCLIDIGFQSTTISVVSEGVLKLSYSVDLAGEEMLKILQEKLKINPREAEYVQYKLGVVGHPVLKDIFKEFFDKFFYEVQNVLREFEKDGGQKPKKIILAGGGAYIKGLAEGLHDRLNLPVEMGNPFVNLSYPKELGNVVKDIGSSLAIALGVGLRGFIK